ncbi:MAG: hypothetical protein ABWW65_07925 [Thermoprotei archaeon]
MVEGDLRKVLDKSFSGDLYYTCVFPHKVIGGLSLSRETIPLDLPLPPGKGLSHALLEIGVRTQNTGVAWRVKANGINVTREFKPTVLTKIGSGYFAKFVFDITSILKSQESVNKSRVNVTFKREGGEPIVIEHLGLLTLYEASEAKATIRYYSGALALEPGEEQSINIGFIGENPIFRSVVYMPHRSAKAIIRINDKHAINLANMQGLNEVLEKLTGIHSIDTVEFVHSSTGEMYNPRQTLVSNLILYRVEYAEPKLVIEDVELYRVSQGIVKARVRITNKGTSRPDKSLLVVMSLGNVLSSKQIKLLEPGSGEVVELELPLQSGEYELVFRVIWRKLAKTSFQDYRLKTSI